jgi:uncharacterized protein (TIGR02452 family)
MEEYSLSKSQRRTRIANGRSMGHKSKNFGGVNPSHDGMVDVFQDTVKMCQTKKLTKVEKESVLIDIYEIEDVTLKDIQTHQGPPVEVCNIDTLDMALDFCKFKMRPLVLNMASNICPGGGVKSGKSAQEECIFRRTNAIYTHPKEWYPLERSQCVYCPDVTILKDSTYNVLPESEQYSVGMLALPALRKPKLLKNCTEYQSTDRERMEIKIEAIFKIAITHGHDALVLGALGCGVFCNPPLEVAQLFKAAIVKYGGFFKRIGFAVLTVKPEDANNFDIFSKVLLY